MARQVNHFYTFVFSTGEGYSKTHKITISLPNVRSLAKHLNHYKRKNPAHRILVAFLSEANGKFITTVKFLPIEYSAQQFLVGYKERLLAHAQESGYELKWSHGLKPKKKLHQGGQ